MSPAQPQPTEEHLQRAFAALHRPDWLAPDLKALAAMASQYGCVVGLARRLAQQPPIAEAPEVPEAQPAIVSLRTWDFPPRLTGNNPIAPARRRTDATAVQMDGDSHETSFS